MRFEMYTLPLLALLIFVTSLVVSTAVDHAPPLKLSNDASPSYSAGPLGQAASALSAIDPLHLIAYWPFEKENELVALDASAHGHSGTLHGNPSFVSHDDDLILSLDGHDDYVLVEDSIDLRASSAFTLSAWVRPRSLDHNPILSKNGFEENAVGGYVLALDGPYLVYGIQGRSFLRSEIANLMPDTWIHVTVVHDGAAFPSTRLYVNGRNVLSGGMSSPDRTGAALLIGRDSRNYFDGEIDEIRIYARALQLSEVEPLFEKTRKIDPVEASSEPTVEASASDPFFSFFRGIGDSLKAASGSY
jgi:hypothetical protein